MTNAAFSQDSPAVTGDYLYNYDISSSATYGRYKLVVSTTSGTIVTKHEDEFFVMPWKLEKDIRRITGINDNKSISDDDLSHIAWMSYLEVLRDVYTHRYGETPRCNPDTGVGFDGTNTSFQTNFYPIADIDGSGTVTGNNTSCATDIDAWWIDNAGHRNRAVVTITEARNGEISVYQDDGSTAIPSNNEGVYLDYWSEYRSFNRDMMRDAVAYLAAHYVVELRMNEVDRVTLADLATNNPVIVKNERRFLNAYRKKIQRVCRPRIDGVNT